MASLARSNTRRLLLLALLVTTTTAHGGECDPTLALLAAAEQAPLVVVGRVGAVTRLDASAYVTTLRVSQALRGTAKPNTDIDIAWEELARARPPRLKEGERVLLALDALPTSSLWRARGRERPDLHVVGADGDALQRDPPAVDLQQLTDYLRLPADAPPPRRATALAQMAAAASDTLSAAALARLVGAPPLVAALTADATATLMQVAASDRRPLPLRRTVVELAGTARLAAAAPQLETLSKSAGPLQAPALLALGEIRGGLPPAQAEALLGNPDAALRAVGARYASGALAERTLPGLARGDVSPAVRIAAVEALAASRTVWGVDGALPVLADSDPPVRAAAAAALGRLGAPAVPALEQAARQVPAQAAGAVTALSLAGPAGVDALKRLQADGPTPTVRDLARLALGQGPHAH
ncbi:MAG: HEAT repeat domain-containing protein [Deltaproteobacteria bacterium]|nr:HEAT repeat domain-containing protein [Deltaproteobacteria bacterium]